MKIPKVSVALRRHSVEYLSAGAGGRECIAQAGARGAEGLHWGGQGGEGIWEEEMQSLTARRRPDVFIIMEKICWCLFAQRNTGGGNILLSSDQGCILKL